MGSKRRNNGGSSSRGSHSKRNNNDHHKQQSHNNEQHQQSPLSSSSDNTTTDQDFCQRFFGDPLFSNLNVSLLFIFATILPMLAWIPHFLSEYSRLRQIQQLEGERQLRMQRARMEVEHQQRRRKLEIENAMNNMMAQGNSIVPSTNAEGDIQILQDSIMGVDPMLNSKSTIHTTTSFDSMYDNNGGTGIVSRQTAQETFRPTLCPDGKTIGYDNWFTLRDAISEVNAIAAEEFLRWNEYLMIVAKNSSIEPPVYTPPEPFVVCPGVTLSQKSIWGSVFSPTYWVSLINSILSLSGVMVGKSSSSSSSSSHNNYAARSPRSKNKLSPIFINAEDITIECEMCTVDLPGTHFSFGPHAKGVKIKGFTFKGATTSSLTFHHHGADVHLEDCYWLYNSGGIVSNNRAPHANVNGADGLMSPPPGSFTTAGAVADLNSTSTVAFYRCVIDDQKQSPRKATVGAGVANVPGMNPPVGHGPGGGINGGQAVASSSFTIRN
eukprot:CAMPEP_0201711254 /NCGR_PEP_ID=MMETSP0578-20130828/59047_1 /ASSEMBLY_ACC=CAM_ASM_000663 /TAXON_ID=267565 /ORGANISM="Skeletonema grethea, Strain CCMP 1804" /LENGTH=493 /DNA_ID=CAMNT_0048200305 /DNA_START=159 /DNA_END=1640 /DNA_ORIENTATION=-